MLNPDGMPNYAAQEHAVMTRSQRRQGILAISLLALGWFTFFGGLATLFWFPWQVGATCAVLGIGTCIAGIMWLGAVTNHE